MSIHDYIREFGLVPIEKHGSDKPFEFELRGGPEPTPYTPFDAMTKGQRDKAQQKRRAKNATARKSRRANRR